jgi:hypothetical protein
MPTITVARYDAAGNSLGYIASKQLKCSAEYRPYQGCSRCTLVFVAKWGDPLVCLKDDLLFISSDGVPVFSGRVVSVEPSLTESTQTVEMDGGWRMLDDIELCSPLEDHFTFGMPEDQNTTGVTFPTITTVFGVFKYLAENTIPRVVPAVRLGEIVKPEVPCKLCGTFKVYAGDKLTKVLETLATMEDCVVGVDASMGLYYLPRNQVLSSSPVTIKVAEDVERSWRTDPCLYASGGNFIHDSRGPTVIEAHTQDSMSSEGIRSYRLIRTADGTDLPYTAKRACWRAPQIQTGPQARRLARGLFRRFFNPDIKVQDLDFFTGPRRLEPHLFPFDVTSGGLSVLREPQLAGQITVEWGDTIKGKITLGENTPDPGSGNPINDPFSEDWGQPSDIPQIDTGDGASVDYYTIPSGQIDLSDGYDGDGDDLHSNPNRAYPDENPDQATEGLVDYGSDTRTGNSTTTPYGIQVWMGKITAESHPTYSVDLYDASWKVIASYRNVGCLPFTLPKLAVGQYVLCYFPAKSRVPKIDGSVVSRVWKGVINSISDYPKYGVTVYAQDGTTAVASFTQVEAWPAPSEPFDLNEKVLVAWENNALKPTIQGPKRTRSFGVGQGSEDQGYAGQLE